MRCPQTTAEHLRWHLTHTRLRLGTPGSTLEQVLPGDAHQAVSGCTQEGASQLPPTRSEERFRVFASHDADMPGGEYSTDESVVMRYQVCTAIGVWIAEAQGVRIGRTDELGVTLIASEAVNSFSTESMVALSALSANSSASWTLISHQSAYGSSALAPCQMIRNRFANPMRPMMAGFSEVPERPFTRRSAWRVSSVSVTTPCNAPG